MPVTKQWACKGTKGERKLFWYISDNKWAEFICNYRKSIWSLKVYLNRSPASCLFSVNFNIINIINISKFQYSHKNSVYICGDLRLTLSLPYVSLRVVIFIASHQVHNFMTYCKTFPFLTQVFGKHTTLSSWCIFLNSAAANPTK